MIDENLSHLKSMPVWLCLIVLKIFNILAHKSKFTVSMLCSWYSQQHPQPNRPPMWIPNYPRRKTNLNPCFVPGSLPAAGVDNKTVTRADCPPLTILKSLKGRKPVSSSERHDRAGLSMYQWSKQSKKARWVGIVRYVKLKNFPRQKTRRNIRSGSLF